MTKKEYHRKYSNDKRALNLSIIRARKSVPCADCNQRFNHVAMDFDHRENKKFTISNNMTLNIEKILKEINKCDVVCSNCHRVRTHNRITSKNRIIK